LGVGLAESEGKERVDGKPTNKKIAQIGCPARKGRNEGMWKQIFKERGGGKKKKDGPFPNIMKSTKDNWGADERVKGQRIGIRK